MRFLFVTFMLAGCSAPAPVAQEPAPVHEEVVVPPDAAGPSAAVEAAPAWVFRYHTADRDETWTLRYRGGDAMIEVSTAAGLTRYLGAATDGDTLELDLAAPTAKIALSCKRARRAIGAACNDASAPEIDLLDCYHEDFDAPMPFGAAPGVEYVVDATCNGYRLVAP